MSFGPGDKDVRKVQQTGGATFTVSLPKPWILANNLQPRDSIRIDWRPSGALRITPLMMAELNYSSVSIHAHQIPDGSLHDHLMGAYISGADEIHIFFKEGDYSQYRLEIRRFLRNTRGFEIIDQTEKGVKLVCLLKAGELPLHASLNRMYLQLTSFVRDILSVFQGDGIEIIEDLEERESEVDGLLYLIQRQVRIALDSHLVASSLRVSRHQALEYSNLAKSLERMMDHAHQMGLNLIEMKGDVSFDFTSPPLSVVPMWQESLKELMINVRTRESLRIESARGQLKQAQLILIEHEEGLIKRKESVENILFEFKLSESIRRMCAYARDFGEILLNLKLNGEMSILQKDLD